MGSWLSCKASSLPIAIGTSKKKEKTCLNYSSVFDIRNKSVQIDVIRGKKIIDVNKE